MADQGLMLGVFLCSPWRRARGPTRRTRTAGRRRRRPPGHGPPRAPRAQPITLNFAGDVDGSKPNGLASLASPAVTFSDTKGADLQVSDFGTQSRGRALVVNTDRDNSAFRITLARPTTLISLAFGNDDLCCSDPGDEAVLTLFRGTTTVSQFRVTMNRNDNMDQTISYGPQALFNRAEF